MKRAQIYSSGIDLEIKDEENSAVILHHKIGDGKAKVCMRNFNGAVFICQSDYRASLGMSDQMSQETDNAFFYEAFVSKMKYLREKFPKQAETLRAGLLEEF